MLLLVGVLLLGQLLSFALHFRDRDAVLQQVAGYNLMQRIAGMVKVLDRLPPGERAAFVEAMDLPPLRVALMREPVQPPSRLRRSMGGTLLHELLHLDLGAQRQVMVYLPENTGPNDGSPPQPMREMMARHMGWPVSQPPAGLMVQVALDDGRWAVFRYRLPSELLGWPSRLLAGLVVLVATVALVSVVAVRWLTRPLSALARAADELGRDLRHAPLPEEGPLEVRRAARAFNEMQRRLARFVDERTRILAAISHDLKTPITRMRLRLEQMEDSDLRRRFERDLDEMQSMVQSSLDFMRGIALQEESTLLDVNALVETLCEDASDAGHPVRMKGRAESPWLGRPLALKRAIGNLLENAVRYGGDAEIEIRDSAETLTILVRDNGPGLPEDMLEKVFEPFFRMEESRNPHTGGTGLGLSIARNIVRAMGGELTLSNRPEGGLEAVVRLPR